MSRQKRIFIVITMAIAVLFGGTCPSMAQLTPENSGIPDYFNTPNWANSPPLRKFVDALPQLGAAKQNLLGQYIPVAIPDKLTYPGSDYYEIEIDKYTERMHSDLPATTLLGYRQTNTIDGSVSQFHYLGPLIIATKGTPVRIKFTNSLDTGSGGDLFVPVDTSIMGAGPFLINYDPETKQPTATITGDFAQNRADLHLHGGRSPWISDGTPHQWITPAGEATAYPKGVSVAYVPDMWFTATGGNINNTTFPGSNCAGNTTCSVPGATNNPGPGHQTYYWSNQQSARLMFFHDHAWGITRLNVYVGEAAGYLLTDETETALAPLLPDEQIPLIIQDKTYVDDNASRWSWVLATDPTWRWGSNPWNWGGTPTPVKGDLWWPHVYMPAQNPFNPDLTGINAFGRWHYGPWFWPPTTNIAYPPVANPYYDPNCDPDAEPFCQPPFMPGTPNPSWGAEAFMDTPVVNGTAYPKLEVQPKQYRFRILNAAHDRFWNLQFYVADTAVPPGCPTCAPNSEVKMVPAVLTPGFPDGWPADDRVGGAPDPATRGPAWIQIGTEGGFLPAPVLLPNQPVVWNTDPTTFTAGLVLQQNEGGGTLMLGPAERADVIVDFTNFAGKTLILYNDAPAPWPALDPHYDYYTGAPDNTEMGGAKSTPVGFGPNTRTIMQIVVSGSGGTAPPDDYDNATLNDLKAEFKSTPGNPGVFQSGQEPIIVGQRAYRDNYNVNFPATWPYWGLSRITDNAISFWKPDGTPVNNFYMEPKAIQDEMGEVFDEYGRMSAKLGLELAFTNAGIQTFILQNFVDPPTENLRNGEVQIWKITHNGVDTHPVHFHLFEVQLLNRVGWDGFLYLPDANELGWKDTVRISPLEDTIVAVRAKAPTLPFPVPDSIRPLNPAFELGSTQGFSNIDPYTGQPTTTVNQMTNFGWEYVWHCHILSHEESDMMRPMTFRISNKLFWRSTPGQANIWELDYSDQFVASKLFGPRSGWTPKDYHRNSDGTSRLLWVNTFGQANLETIDASDNHVKDQLYGPYSGWTAINYDSYPDGTGRLLWGDGAGSARVSKLDAAGTLIGETIFGPYPGWTPILYHINTDGTSKLLWVHTSNQASIWTLDASDSYYVSYQLYGPYSGWTAIDYDQGAGLNGKLLWVHTSNQASIWQLDSSDNLVSYQLHGPYPGWTPRQVHQNLDGTGRLLWEHTSNQASIWTLDSSDNLVSYILHGPFPGWRAIQYQ